MTVKVEWRPRNNTVADWMEEYMSNQITYQELKQKFLQAGYSTVYLYENVVNMEKSRGGRKPLQRSQDSGSEQV